MADPDPSDDGEAHRRKTLALATVGRLHAQRGAATLVVSGVLDPDQLDVTRDTLAGFDLALVRLAVGEDELRRRMTARGQYAEDWSGVLADARRHDAAGHSLPVVRTDEGSPSEVARRVRDVARTLPVVPSSSAGEPATPTGASPGRAALITGCRVVGKSSVGWLAFMRARERRIPTAFVDLRQLGFQGRDGGPVDHELQAAMAGALWPVFHAWGSRLLLLNGTTDDPAQTQWYADRLEPTPLTVIRLTASAAELAARAGSRARGEMAPLAGDDLVGADEHHLRQVVDQALLAQDSRAPVVGERLLDTTTLTATDAAGMVLDLIAGSQPARRF